PARGGIELRGGVSEGVGRAGGRGQGGPPGRCTGGRPRTRIHRRMGVDETEYPVQGTEWSPVSPAPGRGRGRVGVRLRRVPDGAPEREESAMAPPVRLVLANDDPIIVEGLRAMLAP